MEFVRARTWLERFFTYLEHKIEGVQDFLDEKGIALVDAWSDHAPPPSVSRGGVVIGPSHVRQVGPAVVTLPTSPRIPILIPRRTAAIQIAPAPRAAWDDRGWTEYTDGMRLVYDGHYRVRRRDGTIASFPGRIVVEGGKAVPYIANPPAGIRRHSKGPCFQLTEAPWFKVHWRRAASNADDALLYVEKILSEVLK
jgi:hypothetical protein